MMYNVYILAFYMKKNYLRKKNFFLKKLVKKKFVKKNSSKKFVKKNSSKKYVKKN